MKTIVNGILYYFHNGELYSSRQLCYSGTCPYATKFYSKVHSLRNYATDKYGITKVEQALLLAAANCETSAELPREVQVSIDDQVAELIRYASTLGYKYEANRRTFYKPARGGDIFKSRSAMRYVSAEDVISKYNHGTGNLSKCLVSRKYQHLNLQRTKTGWKVHDDNGTRLVTI